jgi:hypothetical protein
MSKNMAAVGRCVLKLGQVRHPDYLRRPSLPMQRSRWSAVLDGTLDLVYRPLHRGCEAWPVIRRDNLCSHLDFLLALWGTTLTSF